MLQWCAEGDRSVVMSTILDELTGPKVPSYFPEMCEKNREIMDNALIEHTVTVLNAEMKGFIDFVHVIYRNAKTSGSSSDDTLYSLLEPRVTNFGINVVSKLKLQPKKMAEFALPTFILAANLHIVFLKELAMNPSCPPESVDNLKGYAERYASHVDTVIRAIEARGIGLSPSFALKTWQIASGYRRGLYVPQQVKFILKSWEECREEVHSTFTKKVDAYKAHATVWKTIAASPLQAAAYSCFDFPSEVVEETVEDRRRLEQLEKELANWTYGPVVIVLFVLLILVLVLGKK